MKWSSSNIPYLQCIMCFTFWNVFVATQWAAGVCVFTEVRIIQIVFLRPDQHLRPQRPIIVSWAPRPVLRGGVPGKTSSQNERWGKLGHEFRSFHPKLFTLTDISAHRDGRGRGSVCFLSDPLWLSISSIYWCHFFRLHSSWDIKQGDYVTIPDNCRRRGRRRQCKFLQI